MIVYAEERRRELVERARSHGRLSVAEAADVYSVTPETIRRDFEALDRSGLLRRVHGGAVPPEAVALPERGLNTRQTERSREKDAIASAALALVPSRGAILLDAGTTVSRLAGLIPDDSTLTVFTNSLPVAQALADLSAASIHLIGGRIRPLTHAAVGDPAVVAGLHVDAAFVGTNGITDRHGMSTPDWDEAVMKRHMVRAADRVVVLADSSKFGVEATVQFAALDDVDVVVTDSSVRRTDAEALTAHGIEVISA